MYLTKTELKNPDRFSILNTVTYVIKYRSHSAIDQLRCIPVVWVQNNMKKEYRTNGMEKF